MSHGWQNPEALDVPGGQQTQRLIEEMCNAALPMSKEVVRAEALRLMAELERTNPNSPALARAKAALQPKRKSMVAKADDGDDDLVEVVRRGLRRSTPQLRIHLIEQVLLGLIDGGDWGSICWLHGEIEGALMEYFQTLNRTDRGVRQEAWRNLGPGLQERLRGRISIERAMR